MCSLFYGGHLSHAQLSSRLLGIGVDDVFVIVQSYENIAKDLPKETTIPYIMAATMKHAVRNNNCFAHYHTSSS